MAARVDVAKWESALVEEVIEAVAGDPYWSQRLGEQNIALHLAVLVEPYLQYILEGRKTIESRFTVTRCAPYDRVQAGDAVLLKRAGGPIVAVCEVSHVWSYDLEPSSWEEIRQGFTDALCAQDPTFWQDREQAAYATLMRISRVTAIRPLSCSKRDRRGWVVLISRQSQFALSL